VGVVGSRDENEQAGEQGMANGSATAGRRTQQQRREETKRRLLDAATRLFAERGSRSVSLADVGRLASSGIVSHHFGSKQRLLAAVVQQAQQFDVPTSGTFGLERLTAALSTYLRTLRDRAPGPQAFLQLWSEAVAADPALAPLFAERDAWFRGLLADHIRSGVDDGSIRGDVDPDAQAIALVGLVRGTALQLMSTAADAPLDVLTDQIMETVRRGLAAAPGAAPPRRRARTSPARLTR
jgi:AcrR family transcriptional regulator